MVLDNTYTRHVKRNPYPMSVRLLLETAAILDKLITKLFFSLKNVSYLRAEENLSRLRECAGWSESALRALAISYLFI